MRGLAFGALVVASAFACGERAPSELPPEGQLLVHLSTDAPLPAPVAATLGADDAPPLFDRARIEIFPPSATTPCGDCTHEFQLDRALVAAGRASMGVVPKPETAGYVARVRMFSSAHLDAGQPRSDGTVDVYVALPPIPAEGITEVTVVLRTDDVAKTVGSLAAPVAALAGRPRDGFAGSWAPAMRRGCSGEPEPGMVCVPGGAFWMGNPRTRSLRHPGDAFALRLVSLEPFYLDATEVTVRAFRDARAAEPRDPMRYDPADGLPGPPLHCTYTNSVANTDDLPVNCLSWARARAYCQKRGADLPTEAQMEYATGALESRPYPWGGDGPTCEDAVYARMPGLSPDYACPGQWLQPPGAGRRDRVSLAGGVLLDLAGNVTEYSRDHWSVVTDACAGAGVLHEPMCDRGASATTPHVMVGGSFVDGAAGLATGTRRPTYDFGVLSKQGPAGGVDAPQLTSVGFRCASPGR